MSAFADILRQALAYRDSRGGRFFRPPEGVPFLARYLGDDTVATPRSPYNTLQEVQLLHVVEAPDFIGTGRKRFPRSPLLAAMVTRCMLEPTELLWLIEYRGLVRLDSGNRSHNYDIQAFAEEIDELVPLVWALDSADVAGPKVLARVDHTRMQDDERVFVGPSVPSPKKTRKGRK